MAVFAPGFPKTRPGPPSKSKQCALTRVRQSSGSRFAVGKPCSQPRPRHHRAEAHYEANLYGRAARRAQAAWQTGVPGTEEQRVNAAEPPARQSRTTPSCAPHCAVGKMWYTLLPGVQGNKQQKSCCVQPCSAPGPCCRGQNPGPPSPSSTPALVPSAGRGHGSSVRRQTAHSHAREWERDAAVTNSA